MPADQIREYWVCAYTGRKGIKKPKFCCFAAGQGTAITKKPRL